MWHEPATVTAPAGEPITLAAAKEFVSIEDDTFDSLIETFIAGARGHIEAMTGTRLVPQTVELRADAWDDFARLPIGPVSAITSIHYLDVDGIEQLLDPGDAELFGEGLQQAIVRAIDVADWPPIRQRKGALRVRLVVGYADLPSPLRIAMLTMTADQFAFRESVAIGATANLVPSSMRIEHLLSNFRVWL